MNNKALTLTLVAIALLLLPRRSSKSDRHPKNGTDDTTDIPQTPDTKQTLFND